jgi:hypothetical protein
VCRLRGLRQPGAHTVGSTSGLCNEEKVRNELYYGKLAAMSDSSVPPLPTVEDVLADLLQLRKGLGKFTVHKLVGRDALIQLCGDGDIMDAYIGLKRDLERCTRSNKHEAAAAWSILAEHETVMDRLVATAELLADDGSDAKDQRSARTWSDRGMPGLARDLVEFAEIRGNLGQNMIGITLVRGRRGEPMLQMVQVVSAHLNIQAPVVSYQTKSASGSDRKINSIVEAASCSESQDARHVIRSVVYEINFIFANLGSPQSIEVMSRKTPQPHFLLSNQLSDYKKIQVEWTVFRSLLVVEFDLTEPGNRD